MSLRRQGKTLFTAIMAFVASAVVVQLWLLTVSVEALLSGTYKTLVPAAAGRISVLLRLLNSLNSFPKTNEADRCQRSASPRIDKC
jgi:hypothetical protein